ncbi:hypothetical protein UlMin_007756, partial [Ulmus minor]
MANFPQILGRFSGICVITLLIASFYVEGQGIGSQTVNVKRSDFPKGFVFGVATSAQQIEGAGKLGGRTPSVWDHFIEKYPAKIKDRSNSDLAIDSYGRYKEDVKLIKDLGVDSYRFSISWSRILPRGSLCGGVNQVGIDYYNNLIDELVNNGIKPVVTILHFDTPQALEDKYGGFLSRLIVQDFKDYCELLFKTYGDRVKTWITINEAFVVALSYDLGNGAPGRCSLGPPFGPCPTGGNSATEPYIVVHNIILAHATAVKLYRDNFKAKQGGEIGITHVAEYAMPYTESSPEDQAAAERHMDFLLGWHVEPLVFGRYPQVMINMVKERLPSFTEAERTLITGAYDFIGINYYTSRYAKRRDPEAPTHYIVDSLVNTTAWRDGVPIGPKADGSGYIYSYPQGLQKIMEFMKLKYRNPKIYITENGFPDRNDPTIKLDEALLDLHRINYVRDHLYYTNVAI